MAEDILSMRVEQAAHSNAIWCDTVCRTHGISGEFCPQIWINHNRTPSFYPNAVTLSGQSGIAKQRTTIQDLIESSALINLSVKDSFNTLDLSSSGFRTLFEATWLWRSPSLPIPTAAIEGTRWAIVKRPDELAQWELAWAALPANQQLTLEARIFLPPLLTNPDVIFVAAYRDKRIVAGAIGHRTGSVVSISNQFAPAGEAYDYWTGFLTTIRAVYPGLAFIGYEQGEDLRLARTLGFEAIGSLRVWVRDSSSV